jgi:peptidyl serine alpha-galactosyltransferase
MQHLRNRGTIGNPLSGTSRIGVKRSRMLWLLIVIPIATALLFTGAGIYLLIPSVPPPKTSSHVLIDMAARTAKETVRYHIVFSTSCIVYQDWQSYTFFYQAVASGQTGIITRIVSGCKDKAEEDNVRAVFEREIVPMAEGRMRIHFTPDYGHIMDGERYPYFNKPFGMRHWLENELGFPKPASETKDPGRDDTIIVLCDPDQMIIQPFPADNDYSRTDWYSPDGKPKWTQVTHGYPMAQLYGFGIQWKRLNMTSIASPDEQPSPVVSMSKDDAQYGYAVSSFVDQIETTWCRLLVSYP